MSLQLRDLNLSVNGVTHLANINADFERGSLTAVIGRTLAGKTTLMRGIAGLQSLDRGAIQLDQQDYGRLPAWKRDIAMVYQQFINYPHLDVFENVAFPLRRKKLAEDVIGQRVRSVLDKVGLGGLKSAALRSCPVASSNASRWRARWPVSRVSCCSMSRWSILITSCVSRCAVNCAACWHSRIKRS